MNCPEHLVCEARFIRIWHIQRADIRRQYVTWREVLNPLRYDISIGPVGRRWTINRDAWMHRAVSNFWFRIWGHRKYKR